MAQQMGFAVAATLPGGAIARPTAGAWTVLFMGCAAGVQMSDRGLQSILSPAIKTSFGVGDGVIGALHGIAGILVASALAVPLARLADRHSRKAVLLGLIATWAALTALGALAPGFPLFFVGRAASGITEFAMIPIVYSLIPDLVEDKWRVTANLIFAALMATGASAGFYFGGAILSFATSITPEGWEAWRVAMLCLSMLGVPLVLAGLTIVDPPHGAQAASSGEGDQPALLPFLQAEARAILLFVGAAGGLAVAVQATVPMAAMALARRFGGDLDGIGHALGLATLATSLGSLPLAGTLDRLLSVRIGERSRPAIMAIGAVLAIPGLIALAVAGTQPMAITLLAIFLFVTCIANALIPTMLQDIVPAALRARSFAIYSFVIAAFCAVGPLLSGMISDRVLAGDLLSAISWAGVPALVLTLLCALSSLCPGQPR